MFFEGYSWCRYKYFYLSGLMKRAPKKCADPKFQLAAATMPITRAQVPPPPAAELCANMQLGALRGTCYSLAPFVLHQHSALW